MRSGMRWNGCVVNNLKMLTTKPYIAIASRSVHSSEWIAVPGAKYTVQEAEIQAALGTIFRRVQPIGRYVEYQIRSRE